MVAVLMAGGPSPAAAEPADMSDTQQLAASHTKDAGAEEDANDPIEPLNRFIFEFNEIFL